MNFDGHFEKWFSASVKVSVHESFWCLTIWMAVLFKTRCILIGMCTAPAKDATPHISSGVFMKKPLKDVKG